MMIKSASEPPRNLILQPGMVFGFGAAVAVWTAWFVTHVPWIKLSEPSRMVIILTVWLAMMAWSGVVARWQATVVAGFISSVLGLLLIGAKLAPQSGESHPDRPAPAFIILGFLALGAVLGLVGGVLGSLVRKTPRSTPSDWLHRFAFVCVAAAAPLLFIGGLVTSTNSGMAVPDWPKTYGANMFLYPLGGAAIPVFLEHSHRLFGTLVGAATLVLT